MYTITIETASLQGFAIRLEEQEEETKVLKAFEEWKPEVKQKRPYKRVAPPNRSRHEAEPDVSETPESV